MAQYLHLLAYILIINQVILISHGKPVETANAAASSAAASSSAASSAGGNANASPVEGVSPAVDPISKDKKISILKKEGPHINEYQQLKKKTLEALQKKNSRLALAVPALDLTEKTTDDNPQRQEALVEANEDLPHLMQRDIDMPFDIFMKDFHMYALKMYKQQHNDQVPAEDDLLEYMYDMLMMMM